MEGSRRAVTLADVARLAQTSRTTASAALGGSGRISPDTRERVRTLAGQLGYTANPAARHLRGGRTGAVALYVPDHLSGYAFYMELALGAAQAARAEGVALTLAAQHPGAPPEPLLAHVDAVVVVDPNAGDPFVESVIASGVPVVAAERVLRGAQPAVTLETDHEAALLDLLDHLWGRGARSPALIALDAPFHWAQLVQAVHRRWCSARGVEPLVRALPVGAGPDAVRAVAAELLTGGRPVDAIVSAADGTALGVLSAARDAGRVVGDDLLVASCVDSLAMQLGHPPVTAIDLQPRAIGRDAADAVLRLLAGEQLPRLVRRRRPPLVVRASTGPGGSGG